MTLHASLSLHPVLRRIKQQPNEVFCVGGKKQTNMAVLDPHPVNKGSVWFHWLFLLYTFIQSLTFRSCVSTDLLPHVSVPGIFSFQSSKIVQEYWVALRELPSESVIPCPPCWTVTFSSVIKEFWVYSVHSSCFMKEDMHAWGEGWLLKNIRQKAVSQRSQPVPPELSWDGAQWYFCWVSISHLPCNLLIPEPCMQLTEKSCYSPHGIYPAVSTFVMNDCHATIQMIFIILFLCFLL